MGSVVNKRELAARLGMSLPTLDALIRRSPDLPVLHRGGKAGAWRFDLDAVLAFVAARQDDARQAQQRDRGQLAALPVPVTAPAERPGATAVRETLEAWRLRRAQREEAERAGALLPVAAVAPALAETFARLSRNMHAFVRQLGRERDWPDPYLRQVEARLAEQQRASVAAALAELGGSLPSGAD